MRKKALVSNTLSDSVSSVYYNATRTCFSISSITASSKKTLPKIVDSDEQITSLSSICKLKRINLQRHMQALIWSLVAATGPLAVEKSKKKRKCKELRVLLVNRWQFPS